MRSSRETLRSVLDKIQGVPIAVVGDVILDRYIWGNVERISQEAPVPVVEVTRIEDRLGGASNVARNLTKIGAKVSLCGFVGNDEEADRVRALLKEEGINADGIVADPTRPTILKTRVIAHSQQMVRVDREDRIVKDSSIEEKLASEIEKQFSGIRALIVSDYGKGAISKPLLDVIDRAQQEGRLGMPSRPVVLDPNERNFPLYSRVTVAKPNKKEAQAATGIKIQSREDADRAADILINRWNADMMLVTLGEGGLLVKEKAASTSHFLDTVAREVFDVSGAGDTVTALFGAALAVGATPEVAGDLANVGAGIVVSEVGTVAVTLKQLLHEIDILSSYRVV